MWFVYECCKVNDIENNSKILYNEGTVANIENDSYQTFSLEFIYIISKKLNVDIAEFFKDIN